MESLREQAPLREDIRVATEALGSVHEKKAAAQSALDEWTTQSQRNRRGGTKVDYANLASGKSVALPKNDELMSNLDAAKKDVLEKDADLKHATDKLTKFATDHCTTVADFKAYGMDIARPVAVEYKRLFLDSSGDYYTIIKANMAARALNPLVAVTMTDLELKETLTDLSAFGFDELRPAAIQDIISEIPAYRAIIASTSVTFWSEVDGADKYDHGLSKKQEGDPEQYTDRTWKDDRIEQSRRVWEWWRVKGSKLHYFFSAARLVAIVPLSSASVERVFSQVKFIIETVGENVLEETLEARVMERVNDYTL